MADFNITFDEDKLTFTDSTDYSGLTITKTDLVITYPVIEASSPINFDLYDENIASLGDSLEIVPANEDSLAQLTDGVYKFQFIGYNGATQVFSVTKYFIYHFGIDNCLRTRIDSEIDKQCAEEWWEIGLIQAILDFAKREAELNRYTSAQDMIDNLTSRCNGC